MPDSDFQSFRAVSHYGKDSITNELEYGLKEWISWSMLKIGAWSNITTGTSGMYGGNFSILHTVNDPSYNARTVYQGIRKDFIWETGVNYVSTTGTHNPLAVQIFANNTGITTGTVGFTHYIDYPNGRIIFNSGQSANITFRAQYSTREVQTYLASDQDWWFEVNYDSWNPIGDAAWVSNITSGDYALASTNRMQMPCIIIEPAVSHTTAAPFELGTLVGKQRQDVLFHILAEDRHTRNNITDILRLQKDKTIVLPDTTKIYASGLLPLNANGMLVNPNAVYPNIVGNTDLIFRHAIIVNTSVSEVKTEHPKLHWAICRATFEILL